MTDNRVRMILIAGAFVLTLGVASITINGIEDTMTFFEGVVGITEIEL